MEGKILELHQQEDYVQVQSLHAQVHEECTKRQRHILRLCSTCIMWISGNGGGQEVDE